MRFDSLSERSVSLAVDRILYMLTFVCQVLFSQNYDSFFAIIFLKKPVTHCIKGFGGEYVNEINLIYLVWRDRFVL